MTTENQNSVLPRKSIILYTGTVGSAWSGTMRGLLTTHYNDGTQQVIAECCNPDVAADLAKKLNKATGIEADELVQTFVKLNEFGDEIRRELHELLGIVDVIPGRDNKNNWKKKIEWILGKFQ